MCDPRKPAFLSYSTGTADKRMSKNVLVVDSNKEECNDLCEALNRVKHRAIPLFSAINLDEKIKMQTVLATLSTKGLTVQKIVESADYYMKVLENEREKFKQAMIKQTQGKIGNKHKQIKDLEEKNRQKAEKIKALTDEINSNTAQMSKLKIDIETSDLKIKSTENNFNVTFDNVAGQIKNKIEKIKTLA